MIPSLRSDQDVRPRFEYYPAGSPSLRTVNVEKTPFLIGRGESTSLQIHSTSVSREHAELSKTPLGYRLRDLGSTNGTSVNGQQISEAPLCDGDTVSIADIELTFVCTSMGRLQRMVTQPLAVKKTPPPSTRVPAELVAERAMGEALLFQMAPLDWSHIVDCGTGADLAKLAAVAPPLAAVLHGSESRDPASAASRLEALTWQLAAEQAAESNSGASLLFRVEQRTSLTPRLLDTLELAADWLTGTRPLGVVVPWEWATHAPETLRTCAELRSRVVVLAFDEFSGGAGCIDDMESAPPDYLLLSPNVVRGVADQSRRLQRLEIVQAGCEAAGIRAVLPAGTSPTDAEACQELGIQLAQQSEGAGVEQETLEPLLV